MAMGLMPGEDDWMTRLRLAGMGGIFGVPDAPVSPGSPVPSAPPADGLLGKLNQATQPFGGPMQLGLAMLANSGPSATKRGFGEILGTSALQAQQGQQSRQEDQLKKRYMEAQIGALDRKPATTPFADVNPSQYTPESVAAFQKSAAIGKPDYSLLQYNPKATDSPSNIREYEYYIKLSPAGKQQYLEMKRSLNPFSIGEMAGGKGAFDRRTGSYTPLTTAAQEATGQAQIAGATAGASETATKTSGAAFDLPRIEQNVQQAIGDIKSLRDHKGLSYITGISSKLPIIPGTPQADADARAKQIEGQTFLQAFNTLKGGGQITEVEGSKATAAIGRLSRAQSTKDYQAALDELSGILQTGLDRARKQAGASSPAMPKTGKRIKVDAQGNVIGN